MLAAVEAIGRLPDVYVQAVGSAAGALAVHEAALRLIGDGRFGDRPPRLVLAQNAPFAPMHSGRSLVTERAAGTSIVPRPTPSTVTVRLQVSGQSRVQTLARSTRVMDWAPFDFAAL